MTPIDLADKCGHAKCVTVLKNAAGKKFQQYLLHIRYKNFS